MRYPNGEGSVRNLTDGLRALGYDSFVRLVGRKARPSCLVTTAPPLVTPRRRCYVRRVRGPLWFVHSILGGVTLSGALRPL